jgi:hypothetical protein
MDENVERWVRDIFAHIGMAVALHYATQEVANMYKLGVNLNLPLPPYPGVLIIRGRRGLVLA